MRLVELHAPRVLSTHPRSYREHLMLISLSAARRQPLSRPLRELTKPGPCRTACAGNVRGLFTTSCHQFADILPHQAHEAHLQGHRVRETRLEAVRPGGLRCRCSIRSSTSVLCFRAMSIILGVREHGVHSSTHVNMSYSVLISEYDSVLKSFDKSLSVHSNNLKSAKAICDHRHAKEIMSRITWPSDSQQASC